MRDLAPHASHWTTPLRPRLVAGNEVTLLQNGAEYFPALERAMVVAKHTVFLETYLFEADPSGWQIARAMAAAAGRGVAVHLIIDGFGCAAFDPVIRQHLQAAGVRIEVFRPENGALLWSRKRLRRMHRKLAVIDGEIGFVGGINVIDDQIDPNHGALAAPRADFAVQLRGPIVASVHLAAWRLWWQLTMTNVPFRMRMRMGKDARREPERRRAPLSRMPDPPGPAPAVAGGLRAMLVLRDNLRLRHSIERAYLRAIGHARQDILIACAYFLPGLRFRRALRSAARRGVRVRLLLQGREEYRLPHWAQQAMYEEFLSAGIEIVEYQPSFLHAKAAVIDDWATVGSSNIDPFSLLLAREANIVVINTDFAQGLRSAIERLIESGGRALVPTLHARRGLFARCLQGLAFGLLRAMVAISGHGAGDRARF
jgi:cardiolipin synthase